MWGILRSTPPLLPPLLTPATGLVVKAIRYRNEARCSPSFAICQGPLGKHSPHGALAGLGEVVPLDLHIPWENIAAAERWNETDTAGVTHSRAAKQQWKQLSGMKEINFVSQLNRNKAFEKQGPDDGGANGERCLTTSSRLKSGSSCLLPASFPIQSPA